MSEPRTTIDDLKVGQVVSVFEPDSTIGVYLVEEVKRAGFIGSLMTDDGPLEGHELTEFRVSAYRNHAGHEWFGIPGLTILSDSSWKPPLVLPTERSLILAEVDDRFTEDKVLLFGPHATKGNTWWSFDGRLSLIPDDINSFEVLWTENAP